MWAIVYLLLSQLILASYCITGAVYTVEDIFIPSECEQIAASGDHILLEYVLRHTNGSILTQLTPPAQLYHINLTPLIDESPVIASVKGMCKNSTRRITWQNGAQMNLEPIFVSTEANLGSLSEPLSLDVTVHHITTTEEYQIFSALRQSNYSKVLDLIEARTAINAVDEWVSQEA